MKTVVVKFDSGRDYHYLVEASVDVNTGDYAVAHNGSNYAIVKVVDILAGASSRAHKTLVTILNKPVYDDYLARNTKVNETKAMFARLEQLLAQENENNKYRLLAQHNSEAAELLAKLGVS